MHKAFTTDLDGTIIYSQKHDFDCEKICVDTYKNYSGYMNKSLYDNLDAYNKRIPFIPVTTRSLEQYKRICLPIQPEYALVLNGAVLLVRGAIDKEWLNESIELSKPYINELCKAIDLTKNFDCSHRKILEQFFVFIKSNEVTHIHDILKKNLDLSKVNIYVKSNKIYVMPQVFEKGEAVRRLKEKYNFDYIIASGDTDMDTSMLNIADKTITCKKLKKGCAYPYE